MARKLREIAGETIKAGETRDVRVKISETYAGDTIAIPVRVIRARVKGPTVFVSAAVHGDELNGTGIVHELVHGEPLQLKRGTLLLVPVVNAFGFENHSRYLPDRRDLNRHFPGSETGSMASRVANIVMKEVVSHCDYGIDLHTAAEQRVNFPNVRGDLTSPGVREVAESFGCELVVDHAGPVGSLRREACRKGCATMILEAGEPNKVEPAVLELGVRGVRNVLIHLGMLGGKLWAPPYQTTVRKTTWVRAEVGGMLRFHISPGDIVDAGQPIASNYAILGEQQNVIEAPQSGIVLGMTTAPVVKPGEPVCHLAIPGRKLKGIRKALDKMGPTNLHQRVRSDLATNISVVDPD